MKKFSIFLPLFLALFFFSLPNVRAEELSGIISTEYFDYDSDNSYTDLKNYIDNYMQQNNLSYYIIYYTMDWNNYTANFNRLLANLYSSSPFYRFTPYDARLNFYSNTVPSISLEKDKNNSTVMIKNTAAFNYLNFYISDTTYGTTYMVIDTNIDFTYAGSNSYTFNSSYGSYTLSNGVKLKGLVELANSTPPDNTPILTNFYTTVGSKIAWLGEQFMDSYIYIAIFGVFILLFLIELLRRYFL